jgi:hypothetical protein
MKWPFRKSHDKGKRAISQRQSHHRNIQRALRDDGSVDPRTRKSPESHRVNWGED